MAARNMKMQKYQDSAGMWRARVKAGNGEQLARTPKGYGTKEELDRRMAVVLKEEHDAEVYADKAGEWRWRFRAHGSSGEILLISSEGHPDKSHCKRMSDQVLDAERA